MDWKPFLQLGFEYDYGTIPDRLHLFLNLGGRLARISRVSLATGDITIQTVDKSGYEYERDVLYDVGQKKIVKGSIRQRQSQSAGHLTRARMPNIVRHLDGLMTNWDDTMSARGFFSFGSMGHMAKAAFHQTRDEYIQWVRQEVGAYGVSLPTDMRIVTRYQTEPVLTNDKINVLYEPNKITLVRPHDRKRPYPSVGIERIASRGLGLTIGAPMPWIFEKLEQHFAALCDPLAWKMTKGDDQPYLIVHSQPRPPRKKKGGKV